MKQKRSSWLYLVLGLMLFSLIIFSGLPLFNSIVAGDRSGINPNSASATTISTQELIQLEAEASGYQKVLQREPENETALQGLLTIRLKQQDLKGSIEPLAKLASLHSEQPEYTILLAQAKQQVNDYEGAAAAYRQVLANNPGDILALRGIANLYLAQNMPERAVSLLTETIETAKRNSDKSAESIDISSVKLVLGELYSNRQQYSDAIAIYDEIASEHKDDFRPVLAKGLVLDKQEDFEAAKTMFDRAYTLAPVQFKDQIKSQLTRLSQKERAKSTPN
jgi:tetratricopeptide (TPR) repeat protein